MKKSVSHIKTTELGVRNMSTVTFNNQRLGAAQKNKGARSLFLVSIQGTYHLREGQTVINCANKQKDKLPGFGERGISKTLILL